MRGIEELRAVVEWAESEGEQFTQDMGAENVLALYRLLHVWGISGISEFLGSDGVKDQAKAYARQLMGFE